MWTDVTVTTHVGATSPQERARVLDDPGFGTAFTDRMFVAEWTEGRGWCSPRITGLEVLRLHPATSALHYAQSIFEGLKAYRHANGSIWTFRPDGNARRFNESAARMDLPNLPEDSFVAAIDALVMADHEWVPTPETEESLYLRPLMFADEAFLGVRSARKVTFAVIAIAAGTYLGQGVKPISVWATPEYVRAAPGGTGAAKTASNYAGSIAAQSHARVHGFDQVVYLDALQHRNLEELGGMNLVLVRKDGALVTPSLEPGTILAGITRGALLELARERGQTVEERTISINEWIDGIEGGLFTEAFACGTAAVVTPIGTLGWEGVRHPIGDGTPGPVTHSLRRALLDIQFGRVPDRFGWMHHVC